MATLLSDSSAGGSTVHTRAPENDSAGLGEMLKRAREHRGLTLAEISNETKIPQRHLEALERDNLAALPGGFYRRAELRAFARAVNLDQTLALAQLERALQSPVAAEAAPEISVTQEPAPVRKGLLIVIGLVVGLAAFGPATGGREPGLDGDAHVHSATDSLQRSVLPVRETPLDAVIRTSQRTQLDQVAPPSSRSEGALAVATEPTGRADSVTELVVTTQPAGARVTVNGIGWGVAPLTIRYLPEGDKRIRVSKDGYTTEERMVRLAEGHPRRLDIRLRSAP